MISDKELIKQLKNEVALLEAKLRISTYSTRNSSDLLIVEKDLQIQKVQFMFVKWSIMILMYMYWFH